MASEEERKSIFKWLSKDPVKYKSYKARQDRIKRLSANPGSSFARLQAQTLKEMDQEKKMKDFHKRLISGETERLDDEAQMKSDIMAKHMATAIRKARTKELEADAKKGRRFEIEKINRQNKKAMELKRSMDRKQMEKDKKGVIS